MRTRVMIVDDSVVIRHILVETLSKNECIEIVGAARDGLDAIAKIDGWNPEVVLLDVEMPNMDGIETLTNIKRTHPGVKVIMFSTLTSRGADATLDALMAGADDYVTKPSNVGSMNAAIDSINRELLPRIRALKFPHLPGSAFSSNDPCRPTEMHSPPPLVKTTATDKSAPRITPPPNNLRRAPAIKAVCIAVSTGGPNALAELIPTINAEIGVPIFIVQHIPPMFSAALALRLDKSATVSVCEASAGDEVKPGHVYLAPGGHHMVIEGSANAARIGLNEGPPENSCRPAADVMFRSAVRVYGSAILGVILTGMGADGTKGGQNIVSSGGRVIVQDEASSVIWGMPGAAVDAGIAEAQYPLKELGNQINNRASSLLNRISVR